jgi:uncharacterized membrane protein
LTGHRQRTAANGTPSGAKSKRRDVAPTTTHHGAFGDDPFGQAAERVARFLGTPQYLVGQTVIVGVWIVLNTVALVARWDPYRFILLNLAFSTQAAYAAPLILLAQTRQADRDKHDLAAPSGGSPHSSMGSRPRPIASLRFWSRTRP